MAAPTLRQALYYRFHRLVPFIAHPAARPLGRALLLAATLLWFAFVLAVLVLRYAVLPNIESYRGDIERLVSEGVGLQVNIGRIEARWAGVNPDLTLLDVRVADAAGRPALAFSRVQTVLSWWTVTTLRPQLRLLAIDEPTLHLRRDADGRIFVAGIPLNDQSADTGASDWILEQRHIRIRGATIVWEDAQRGAPPLILEDVNFGLDNSGRRHRFGLTALPPRELAAKIDVRGDFRGRDIEVAESWKGQLYAEIDYADLAVWQRWIDYPFALPQGRGAVRAWADFADGRLSELTADLALRDLRLRLAKKLPELELERMQGRLGVAFSEHGFSLSGKQLTLATRASADEADAAAAGKGKTAAAEQRVLPAVIIPPSDFRVDWQPGADEAVSGSASANRVDLAALSALAAYLPLDARSRQLLADYAPRGLISDLRASWNGDAESMKQYALKARFDALAIAAQGYFPGFSGLSGNIDLNEKAGSASLNAQKASIDLPSVFPEAQIAFDTLSAQAKWTRRDGVVDAELVRADFAGADAAGAAQGTYRLTGDGPGTINLSATLSRADARAVWRFMPHVVNANARHWLRDALVSGTASDAQLTLKGDLAHFPFIDKTQGQFLVTARAHNVTLDYAPGWPKITGIDGLLRFEGPGMVVDAERGMILGARLSATRAEIADFDAPMTMLKVKGHAEGPTSEFLKFIELSPVAEQIDRFTEDMRASGDGSLDLALSLPLDLALMDQSQVDGTFRLVNNEVVVDSALPALRQVNGQLRFSEKSISVPEINATLFGGPLQIKGGSAPDGRVLISASGSLAAAQLRKAVDLPLADNLSGSMTYRGEVRVRKRSADLVVESTLAGLGSSLPEPFHKSAGETMPLRFEKTSLPAATVRAARGAPVTTLARDQLRFSLGNAVSAQIIRRRQGNEFAVERGAVAIGRPLQLPERGLALNVSARQLDADLWRHLLRAGNAGSNAPPAAAAAAPLPVTAASLKAGELRIFGRRFNDVDLAAAASGAQWQMRLASRQANGDVSWDGSGRGKLSARLKQLSIEAPSPVASVPAEVVEAVDELPALDIVAEDFAIGARRFGRLEVSARNEGRLWRLERVRLANPAGSLNGSGQWQLAGGNRTLLDFKLVASDVGKLLERLGFPGTVRGGTAQLDGNLSWVGPPSALDYATLSGEMKVEAAKGQFTKLDPGAGKLIGLISLQSLPRRVTLDFRDIFSEGFAFDSIAGKLTVQGGVMHTERLQIDGPAAHVVMRGDADLARETQRLSVNVQPELGGTAALGIGLINPIAGVATLLAHKILQNPLNQMFGFDYLVTGTWDDPKVDKISRAAAAETPSLRSPEGAAATPSPAPAPAPSSPAVSGDSRDKSSATSPSATQ
ncbi:YhdP family protein [Rhodocyclus tenuis]|uniref:YhdP family protein n=1 Tax=Rhodocyclus tenuis TaxID=1066 RepID=UPI001908EF71|nr:YhdP family protein [Rhodocyclus tenuis]